ncbi:hypothetical protein ACIQHV_30785 [Bacillus bombysepticus]|uniref:Uncharacterized protein n=1 Tax=Bacillus thuringiensis serovar kumamotoensis TaxID=132267 RepID=A0A9X6JPM0_BACUK|nr:hypothetical protein [Bacillus thuringiensis]MEC2872574.1 hypothetical protein [Bacillus cereus]OTZ72931.1 hypothetical protein BK769_15095 [Bacillus thuringiensis serovar kumamtoensis]
MSEECSFKECHSILIHSKANVLIVNENKDMRENILTWIETTSYEEFKRQRENGLGIDVIIPIGLNNNTSKEDYERLQNYIKEGKVIQFSHSEASHIVSMNTDPEVYRQWGECMSKMIDCVKNSGYGLHCEPTYRGNEIVIRIWYTPYNPEDPWPKIKTDMYVPTNAECVHDCLTTSTVFDRELTVVIIRTGSGNGTIIVNTDKGVVQVPLLPKIEEDHLPQIQTALEQHMMKRLVEAGAKLEPYGNRMNIMMKVNRHRASIYIKDFQVKGDHIYFIFMLERRLEYIFSYRGRPEHIHGREKAQFPLEIDFNLSDLELTSRLFCKSPTDKFKLAFEINELCLTAQEIWDVIIEQLYQYKLFVSDEFDEEYSWGFN